MQFLLHTGDVICHMLHSNQEQYKTAKGENNKISTGLSIEYEM